MMAFTCQTRKNVCSKFVVTYIYILYKDDNNNNDDDNVDEENDDDDEYIRSHDG